MQSDGVTAKTQGDFVVLSVRHSQYFTRIFASLLVIVGADGQAASAELIELSNVLSVYEATFRTRKLKDSLYNYALAVKKVATELYKVVPVYKRAKELDPTQRASTILAEIRDALDESYLRKDEPFETKAIARSFSRANLQNTGTLFNDLADLRQKAFSVARSIGDGFDYDMIMITKKLLSFCGAYSFSDFAYVARERKYYYDSMEEIEGPVRMKFVKQP